MKSKSDYNTLFLWPSCILVSCCFFIEAMMIWTVWEYRIDAWEDTINMLKRNGWNYFRLASTDASWITLWITTAVFVIPELLKVIWKLLKATQSKDVEPDYESIRLECDKF